MKKDIKICFISRAIYPYLAKIDIETAGGAERQQYILSKKLQKEGLDISFIVGEYNQNKIEYINNFKIIKSFYLFRNNKILKFIFDFILLFSAIRKAEADIYYQRILHYTTAFSVFLCKILQKKYIVAIANDSTVDINNIKNTNPIKRYILKFGVTNADLVIVQSKFQQDELKKNYNRNSKIIKNVSFIKNNIISKQKRLIILWVGTINRRKNPKLFLKIAKTYPNLEFLLIGGPSNDTFYYNEIKNELKKIKNLKYLGYVHPQKINKFYNKALMLINTSKKGVEGFPNTFLEAWSNYVPVISLNIDPDECICKNKLGFHSRNFNRMIEQIKLLSKNEALQSELGKNARKYVEKEHNIDIIYKKYIQLFAMLKK